MTLDPNARQVHQVVSVAPSPATSGTDWHIDHALTYFFNSLEQTAPFKVTVYPQGESPTKDNSEVILVQAYSASTRTGLAAVAEIYPGHTAPGSVDIAETQVGSSTVPQSEIQTITLDATGGTFTLSFGGNTTATINFNDTAATVQTRLRALASIGSTGCSVTGSAGGPYTVTFTGALANLPQAVITADASLLTTGGAGSVAVVETTHGGGGTNEVQTITVTADDGTWTATFGGQTTPTLPWDVTPDSLQLELQALSSIGSGNVTVEGAAGGSYTVTFVGALAGVAEALITADASLLTAGGVAEVQSVTVDADAGTFRLSADGGTNYTAALAYNASAATVQTALQGLAAIGSGNCQVQYDSVSSIYTVTWTGAKTNAAQSLLVADSSSLTVTTAHITSCLRAQDGTTARAIVVGDHVEVAILPDAGTIVESLAAGSTTNDWAPSGYASAAQILVAKSGVGATPIITGLAGGSDGRRVSIICNIGPVQFNHRDGGSTTTNRFYMADGQNVTLRNTSYLPETITFEFYSGLGWIEQARTHVAVTGENSVGLVTVGTGAGSAADDGLVVHLAGTETITGVKNILLGDINLRFHSALTGSTSYNSDGTGGFTVFDMTACSAVRVNASAVIYGCVLPGTANNGKMWLLFALGAVTLKHNNTGEAVAGARLLCSGGADISLATNDIALFAYDWTTAAWRVSKL